MRAARRTYATEAVRAANGLTSVVAIELPSLDYSRNRVWSMDACCEGRKIGSRRESFLAYSRGLR